MKGKKFDQTKTRFDLIDPYYHEDLAKVLTYGAIKYEENNWQKLPDAKKRYIAALERHLNKVKKGILFDHESTLQHTAHIACNAMFLHWLFRNYLGGNNNENIRVFKEYGSEDDKGNISPIKDHKVSRKSNPDQTARLRKRAHEVVDEILDGGGTYIGFRARLRHLCTSWDQPSIPSPDNETPDRVLY